MLRERKGADHTLAALKSIRAAGPGGYRLFVILDNLSANKTPPHGQSCMSNRVLTQPGGAPSG